jgi:hypothetical protein
MGVKKKVYRLLLGKPEGKRPPGRPRCRNMKINLVEIGQDSVYWICLAQDKDNLRALMNAAVKLWAL